MCVDYFMVEVEERLVTEGSWRFSHSTGNSVPCYKEVA